MPVKDLDILKAIILKEAETENLPQGFEDDPMGFIVKKYPGLHEVLIYLMTESFRDYVDAIFVVAPKPTTFKIVLHNGQFYFLQFMGKTYQATVSGKNYYLMSIGEKERCMLAIARLLRYGNPLKTKGPEGAEQGTRPAGEEAGGETGAEVPEATPEAGGEKAPVTESMILEAILKKTLNEESEEDESKKVWSKTLTVKDLKKPTPAKWIKKGYKTRGSLLYYLITSGKSIEVSKVAGNTSETSLKKLKFIGDFDSKFKQSDYSSINDTEKIFTDYDRSEEYALSNIVKTGDFKGATKGATSKHEVKACDQLNSEIERVKVEDKISSLDIVIGKNTYPNIVSAEIQEETKGEKKPKSDIVLVDSSGNKKVFISHKDGSDAKGFISWSSIQNIPETGSEIDEFRQKIEFIAKQELGNNWKDFFVNEKTKKSFYTKITDEIIKKLIYGKDFSSNPGKNNVQIIIQGGDLKIKKEGDNYKISGYNKAWVDGEIPTNDYRPILVARFSSDSNSFGFKNCKVYAAPLAQQKNSGEDLTSFNIESTYTSTDDKQKKQKKQKKKIPKEYTSIIKLGDVSYIYVDESWAKRTIDDYQKYFENNSAKAPVSIRRNIRGANYILLKPEFTSSFDIS